MSVKRIAMWSVLVLMLFTAPAGYSATKLIAAWKADQIAALPTELVRLRTKDGVFGVVQRSRVVAVVDALSRIQAAAGISAELLIVHFSDGSPNAFAKVTDDDRKVVAVTISMLDLIGEDVDAYAAILGHELTHIVKKHGAAREARRGFLQFLGIVGGLAIGAATGFNPGSLLDLGTSLVDRTFSREEEREADKVGFDYMVKAGFDGEGAVRAHEKMMSAQKTRSVPFLSTHPGGEERVASFRQMIAALPPKPVSDATVLAATRQTPAPAAADSPPMAFVARVVDARALLFSGAKINAFVDKSSAGTRPDVAHVRTSFEPGDGTVQQNEWTVMCTERRIYLNGFVRTSASGDEEAREKHDSPRLIWPDDKIAREHAVFVPSLFGLCEQRARAPAQSKPEADQPAAEPPPDAPNVDGAAGAG